MTGIIILNWNGWEDTVECLKSLYEIDDVEFFIVLIDNGSTDESIRKIEEFLNYRKDINWELVIEGEEKREREHSIRNKTTILYSLGENYGFAKGNNMGIELAKWYYPKYLLLLNNDTEVVPDFLSKLIKFILIRPQYTALCPKISLYYRKDIIWNCGGSITWGFRRYHYGGKPENTIREKEYIDATYVTGCAFFFRTSLVAEQPLLTEKFFHGEEDFELGYRFKRLGYKMACVLDSHIYHKVGVTTKNLDSVGKKYCYYLLRFIDVRQQMPHISFAIWKMVYSIYIILLLRKNKVKWKKIVKFLTQLYIESYELDGVDKKKFFELLQRGI